MFGLVDANNFYASCERAFDPSLIGQPACVLPNNDGCAIARSQECKDLGVTMAHPIHEVPPAIRRQLRILSANFALYGDLSGRIAGILRMYFPQVEIYSIDESFVRSDGIPATQHTQTATEVRTRILQWVGIPCCAGIAPTKTLAKLANDLDKHHTSGVCTLLPSDPQLYGASDASSANVYRRTASDALAICSRPMPNCCAAAMASHWRTSNRSCRATSVTNWNTPKASSFGQAITHCDDLQHALSRFVQRACEKLRQRHLQAFGLWLWFATAPNRTHAPHYHPAQAISFPAATSDTRLILRAAQDMTRTLYRSGHAFKKAGISLLDLQSDNVQQGDLFTSSTTRRSTQQAVRWASNQNHLSPACTTRRDQLLKVR